MSDFFSDYAGLLGIIGRAAAVLIAFCVFFLCERYRRYSKIYSYLQLFVCFLGLWNLFYVAYALTTLPEAAAFYNSLIFSANSFTVTFWVSFALYYTWPTIGSRFLAPFMVMSFMTTLFALLYPFHSFMFSYDYVFTGQFGMRIPEFYGPWYYVHLVYGYTATAAGTVFLLIKLFRKATPNKKTVALLIAAVVLLFTQNVISTVFPGFSPELLFVCGGITHLLCVVFIWAAVYFDRVEALILAAAKHGDDLFPVPVMITDKERNVVYMSAASVSILKRKGLLPKAGMFSIQDLAAHFRRKEIAFPSVQREEDSGLEKFYLIEEIDGDSLHYVEVRRVFDKRKRHIGFIYSLNDISRVGQLLVMLEDSAFKDTLTGAYNRHYLRLKENAVIEKKPFVVIMMCDIDNLKAVNDIFGHTAGDQYIKACVDALFSSVRKPDLIFRIGGDEFLVVLKDSSEGEMVKSLRKRIRKNLKLPNFPGIRCGFSIGTAAGTISSEQDFAELMNQADANMYREKNFRKSLDERGGGGENPRLKR